MSNGINGTMADNRLHGRIAVVTGSSSGLGRAMCLKFASAGARVVCADLRPTARPLKADKAPPTPTHEAIIKSNGPDAAVFVECDVSKEESIQALVAAAAKWGGRVDIMCNNAGIATEVAAGLQLRIHDTPTADYDLTHLINERAVWLGCKYAIQQMLAQSPRPPNARGEETRGWIINTASMLGLIGLRGGPCYVPAKHGVVGITRQVAIDYAADRIHCNALCPGFVNSAMIDPLLPDSDAEAALAAGHPWGRLGRPEDVADAALFLASDESAWMTGHPMVIDGGYTCQ